MPASDLLEDLIESLRCLPGVGPKSAQRMALHLLRRDRGAATQLGEILINAMENIRHCQQCRIFTEESLCRWCSDISRLSSQLCIVENQADVLAIDRATDYRGKFFLLLGRLSPLDGIGPRDLGLDQLESRLEQGDIDEITLATNPTVEVRLRLVTSQILQPGTACLYCRLREVCQWVVSWNLRTAER